MLLKGKLKLITFIIIFAVMTGLVFFAYYSSSSDNKNDLLNGHPLVVNSEKIVGSNQFEALRITPESLNDVVNNADYILVGEVMTDAITVEKPHMSQENSPLEKKYLEKFDSQKKRIFSVAQTKVKVEEVIYGSMDIGKEITYSQLGQAGNDKYQTKVKKGERVMLILKRNPENDTYASVDFENGVFIVSKNGKVRSLSDNKVVAHYDGIDLGVLKKDLIMEKNK